MTEVDTMRHRLFRSAALILVLPAVSGCSLAFVHGPPDNHRELTSFECTESRTRPILDFILAGSSFLAAGGDPNQYGYNDPSFETQNTFNILGALLYGISGAVGISRVNECRRAKQELRARLEATGAPTSR
jgi:hypothetical protein